MIRKVVSAVLLLCAGGLISCGGNAGNREDPIPLVVTKAEVPEEEGEIGINDALPDAPAGLHTLFSMTPGSIVSWTAAGSCLDATGETITSDWDGDGVPNDREMALGTNPRVTDHPRITVRTGHPVIMELAYNRSGEKRAHSEMIGEENTRSTRTQNMDETHYAKLNQKTTPYVVKSSESEAGSSANSYGYANSDEISIKSSFNFAVLELFKIGAGLGLTQKTSRSENWSFSNSFNRSSMSEKTVFDDVNYRDNMDASGMELRDSKIIEMESRYRTSEIAHDTVTWGPEAGVVRAAIYFRNESVAMPVKLSNVICTLLFKLPGGRLEAITNFRLEFDGGRPFEVEIGGGDETPPYAVVVEGINSEKVRQALKNGHLPVISIFSCDMTLVDDSSYRPGVRNLKQVEEGAKGRTAVIKITAPGRRDIHRVVAFDEEEGGDLSPGISLKKALFSMLRSPLKGGERWERDAMNRVLTVDKEGLWWHTAYAGDIWSGEHEYLYGDNRAGNEWDYFATEVKTYTDEFNTLRRLETIKRIGNERDLFGNYVNQKYNPFSRNDNPGYDENESLPEGELLKTKYWVILHNGKYFEGDINDPVWPGDRYEIILYNMQDFITHMEHYVYTPLQSRELIRFDTRWNALVNDSHEMARAVRLGSVRRGDVVRLDVHLKESRFLFDASLDTSPSGGVPQPLDISSRESPLAWWDFRYTLEPEVKEMNGIPESFSHAAEGGVNSIRVHINESRFARYYMIDIDGGSGHAPTSRNMRVTAEELKQANGDVYLHGKTTDGNGNEMGRIPEGRYMVSVSAHGENFGCPVKTTSAANGLADAVVMVTDASTREPSNGFSFSVMSLYREKLFVRISPLPNTEYFLIRCFGPMNYYGADSPVKEVRGHAGLNVIEIDHPFAGMEEAQNPGVYEVRVYAVNGNCLDQGTERESSLARTEAAGGPVYVNVEYDSYRYQREVAPRRWVPESEVDTDAAAPIRSFGLNAIDLEVNFNEGSGWWRLKLANDDRGAGGRDIECRFTSIIENYRGQHFVIHFTPPAGTSNQFHNVFRSSDDEVDIYIRTVAEKRYRDTFWMKNLSPDRAFSVKGNCVITGPAVRDFASYWQGLDETDASRFEETIGRWRTPSPLGYGGGAPALVEPVESNAAYFFSPLEQRKYLLSAMIAEPDSLVETRPTRLDLPSFRAVPGPRCIYLNGIVSRYADSFEVWWRKFDRTASYGSSLTLEGVMWDAGAGAPVSSDASNWNMVMAYPDESGNCATVLPDCEANQYYAVAVVGKNGALNGTSDARFAFDRNGSGDNIRFIMPYPSSPPDATPGLQTHVEGRSVVIEVAPVGDECRYLLEWKESCDDIWSVHDTYDGTGESLAWNGARYTARDLNPRSLYTVRARAVTLNNLAGPAVECEVETGMEGGLQYYFDWDRPPIVGTLPGQSMSNTLDAALICSVDEMPEGTAYCQLKGSVSCNYFEGWFFPGNQRKRYFFDLRLTPDNPEAELVRFTPVSAWLGIFHLLSYRNFVVDGSIRSYNVHGVDITPVDPERGTVRDRLNWSYQPCPQPVGW